MTTAHPGEPVAGRDLLARVDWCREVSLSGKRKAPGHLPDCVAQPDAKAAPPDASFVWLVSWGV